jgi:hypothetical protein
MKRNSVLREDVPDNSAPWQQHRCKSPKEEWQVDPGLLYGQVHKIRNGRRLKYVVSMIVCGTRARFRAAMHRLRFSGRVQTAYIERFNLYLRETEVARWGAMAPLSRRTWSLAQTEEWLNHHLHWSLACYHLGPWRRRSARGPGQCATF